MALLLIGTALSDMCAGLGYRGSLQLISGSAPQEQRAEVKSRYLLACYGGNSLPVSGIGVLGALTSELTATRTFASTITLLALGATVIGRPRLSRSLRSKTSHATTAVA